MDVRCGRCGTEYEFDDALISERGTTVKCTNCGYQFKVFPDAAALAPERWVVRTATGRELVYTSLRELQRGIANGYVNANDLLSRGNREARPLASIPELEPFLHQPSGGAHRPVPRTLHGVAPAANSSKGGVGPPSLARSPDSQPASSGNGREPRHTPALDDTLEAVTQRRATPLAGTVRLADLANAVPTGPGGTISLPGTAPKSNPPASAGSVESTSPPTIPKDLSALHDTAPAAPTVGTPSVAHASTKRAPGAGGTVDATVSSQNEASSRRTNAAGSRQGEAGSDHVSRLEEARALLQHEDQTDSHYVQTPTRRHARSRWLVFVVVLGAGGLLAATVGKRYLTQFTKIDTEQPVEADARVTQLLSDGERLMGAGDLEGAKEAFSKASALAEGHPKVLMSLAALEVLRADLVWIRLRLLDPDDKASIERTHRELGDHVGRAERAVAAAERVAPEDPMTQRLLVQTNRLHGRLDQARRHVAALSRNSSLPENAYALAALDMAETTPVWSSIVHRLRIASATEGGVGRARSALIYALARSGESDAAKAELEKLTKANPSHPLLFDLREFVARYPEQAADAGADAGPAAVDPARLPELNTKERGEQTADAEPSGDFRAQLKQAYAANERGDLAQAERLYRAVLERQPENTEALAGLADVAHKRNDTDQASRLYAKVLEKNPSYLPALVASADQKWAAGDRAGALELYRRILDRAGADSSYGRHAAARIQQGAASTSTDKRAPNAPAEPAPSKPSNEQPPSDSEPTDVPPTSNDTPHIDTTDLPEFNQ